MRIKEIQEFAEVRPKIRAYLCYLFNRNIPNRLPQPDFATVEGGLKKMRREISIFDALYILNANGKQLTDNITKNPKYRKGLGENRSHRAYFYRAAREKKCILTDPYPSALDGSIVVTASYPIYDEENRLCYIACVDIPLHDALHIFRTGRADAAFGVFSKLVYGALSVFLFFVAALLFIKGISSISQALTHFNVLDIKEIFEATILLTLALAIFDLVKAIFEEEVLGKYAREDSLQLHKTMIRFLGSIIIAISIEALMLVFKFTIIEPEKIVYAVYLIGGVTMLLIGLALYLRLGARTEQEINK